MKTTIALIFAILIAGCGDAIDTFKEGFKHGQEVSSDIEKSIGAKPFVGFNWNNGSLTNVSVTFQGVPPGKSIDEIAEAARTSVARRFKQTPSQIVLSFSIRP